MFSSLCVLCNALCGVGGGAQRTAERALGSSWGVPPQPTANECGEDEAEDAEPISIRVTDHSETWDCESVLSFASNLDNHPAVLSSSSGSKGRRLRRSPQGRIHEDEDVGQEAVERPVEPLLTRAKGETAEDKKARKQAVKQAKRDARIRKKEKKIEYKHVKLNKQQQQHQAQASIRPY